MTVTASAPRTALTPARASLIAGAALLLMAVLAGLGNFGALGALVVAGDPDQTAANIDANPVLFTSGVVALAVVALLDVVAAVALRALFAGVSATLATVAAILRVAYAAVFLVAVAQLGLSVPAADPDAVLAAVDTFTYVWDVALIVFGVHLLLIGYLLLRSRFSRPVFAYLLAVAGLGYLIDGVGVFIPSYALTISQFAFVGEVVFLGWLLIRGRRLPGPAAH